MTIPGSVTAIGESAFYNCKKLTSVTYCGTEEQWNNISISSNNSYLTKATRYYHDFSEVTCLSPKTCSICGYVDSEVWEHSGEWMTLVPANCTADGIAARVCTVCCVTETQAIPAGHHYQSVVTAPTCTEQGYTTHTCSSCGDQYVDSYVAAKGHSWSAWVTTAAATCTKDGSQMRFCGCGTKETEVLPMLPHEFTDGVCSVCGATEVQKFDIDVARMILGNALEFQFGVAITKIPDTTGYYAVIEKTWADGANTVKTIPAFDWGVVGPYYAIVYDGLAAKEMADTFYVTIYNDKNQAVSNAKTDSVRDYVERAYASQSSTGKTMMVDMLNYGAAAQVYFSYGTEDLANSKLTDEQKAAGTAATPSITNSQDKGDFYLGTRFILKSRIQVQLAFANLTEDMYAIYTYTRADGESKEIRVEGTDFVASGDKKIGVELSALVYSDARTLVTVTIYNADGTVYGTATDSIESCAYRSGGDVFVAMMKFADSVKAHLYN